MPSPPLIDYDSDYDDFANLSDWEYDHDAYWDQDRPRKRKRKNSREDTDEVKDRPKKKRRRLDCNKDIPGLHLEGYNTAAPTVIWKSKCDLLNPPEGPIVRAGQGQKVALLKDWRERFRSQPNHTAARPEPNFTKRRGSQVATAVVIGDGSPESYHSTTLPPTTLEKATGLPSRSRVFPSIPEHVSPVVNGTISNTSDSELLPGGSNSSRLARNTTMAGKKRNIEEVPEHQEDELPASKKRPGRPKKKTNDPQLSKQPLASRTNGSIPESRKRKADDSDDQSVMSPPKRAETAKTKGVETSASEGYGSSTRRTTRRTR